MDTRLAFNLLPQLLPGERILHLKQWVWGASFKSFPTYRLFLSVPPLWEQGFYVTDRRVILVTYLFRLLSLETSLWLPGKAERPDSEFISEAHARSDHPLGTYLEIISEDPTRRWYRSRQLRSRIFMRGAEDVRKLISDRL